jgi:hypothetical protein
MPILLLFLHELLTRLINSVFLNCLPRNDLSISSWDDVAIKIAYLSNYKPRNTATRILTFDITETKRIL